MAAITYKALGALLDYPEAELIEALPEIGGVLESDPALSATTKSGLRRLVQGYGSSRIRELCS